jgi:hypothetical protein
LIRLIIGSIVQNQSNFNIIINQTPVYQEELDIINFINRNFRVKELKTFNDDFYI